MQADDAEAQPADCPQPASGASHHEKEDSGRQSVHTPKRQGRAERGHKWRQDEGIERRVVQLEERKLRGITVKAAASQKNDRAVDIKALPRIYVKREAKQGDRMLKVGGRTE